MGSTINKALGPGCPAAGSANQGPTAHTALIPVSGEQEKRPVTEERPPTASICAGWAWEHMLPVAH